MSELAFPGDCLGSANQFSSGNGTYVREGQIYSSLVGTMMTDPAGAGSAQRPALHIIPKTSKAADYVVRIGDTVLCKVGRVNYNQAFVDILMVGDLPLPFPVKAVIRREDIREKEIDKVVVHEFFKPQDVVRAVVISLGDSKAYFLSIARPGLGVILQTNSDDTMFA